MVVLIVVMCITVAAVKQCGHPMVSLAIPVSFTYSDVSFLALVNPAAGPFLTCNGLPVVSEFISFFESAK